MKKTFAVSLFAFALIFLLSGCASSERMARLSAGIVDEYSVPKSYRTRSEKYMKVTQKQLKDRSAAKQKIGDLNESLVNIWPFYFRSKDYFSILWPFIDFDPYGMAIRPLYNQEGDDHSILFPLSSWNTATNSGWVLNTIWSYPTTYMFLPLFVHHEVKNHDIFRMYTPLYIQEVKYPDWEQYKTKNQWIPGNRPLSKLYILLWYYNVEQYCDLGKWNFLRYYNPKKPYDKWKKNELIYHLAGTNEKVPTNEKEYNAFRLKKIKENLKITDYPNFGIPLFFSYKKIPNETSWRGGPLCFFGSKNGDKFFEWDIMGAIIAAYENRQRNAPGNLYVRPDKTKYDSILLLSSINTTQNYKDTGTVKILNTLKKLSHGGIATFHRNLPEIKKQFALLKKDFPADRIKNGETLKMYLQEHYTSTDYPLNPKRYHGFTGMMFFYDFDKQNNDTFWFALPLLTCYSAKKDSSTFWSVPLLSFKDTNKNRDITGIMPPFVYFHRTDRYEPWTRRINPQTTKWVNENQSCETEGLYSLCGLFFRGKHSFMVAKAGLDAKKLEKVRANLFELHREQKYLADRQVRLNKEKEKTKNWKTKTKIEYYRRMIKIEEEKIATDKLERDLLKYKKKLNDTQTNAKTFGVTFTEKDIKQYNSMLEVVKKLFAINTEIRAKSDIGNGLFFRKENYYNGDYKWHLLGILANGEKNGAMEYIQVLHFLYRHRQEGARSETVYFPFIAIKKDGKDSRFSFMGRIFERTIRNGKSSGYILGIPY
ncbi:MAG: hypothetical protein IKB16_05430 [Lentisphaeria bacterium]|nr:hypothetical protein [Lentisphaeria bacterium]